MRNTTQRYALSLLFPCLLAFAILLMWHGKADAYTRYNDGCQTCHGNFKNNTSTKGSVFPGGNKHEMHRNSAAMNNDCDLCHTNGDNDDPYIGSSNGTNSSPGLGCVGCHGRAEDAGNDTSAAGVPFSAGLGAGLRQHHTNANVTSCQNCHRDANPANYTPVGENVAPAFYGNADNNANNPCNPAAAATTNENWTIGDFIGLDNDGDGLYDLADSDCQVQCEDRDQDGVTTCDGDCDDNNPAVTAMSTWYADRDVDTYGNPLVNQLACTKPAGYLADNSDCDDSNPLINPGAVEGPSTSPVCTDGKDNDCDGLVDLSESSCQGGGITPGGNMTPVLQLLLLGQ